MTPKKSRPKKKKRFKPRWTGVGVALFSFVTALAALPYQLGDIATIIPPEWKAKVTAVGLGAAFVLRIINQTTT